MARTKRRSDNIRAVAVVPPAQEKLSALIDSATARLREKPLEGHDRESAIRFFRTVDAALIEQEVIFPPEGSAELLTEGKRKGGELCTLHLVVG